jgi:hypothetical protein
MRSHRRVPDERETTTKMFLNKITGPVEKKVVDLERHGNNII